MKLVKLFVSPVWPEIERFVLLLYCQPLGLVDLVDLIGSFFAFSTTS